MINSKLFRRNLLFNYFNCTQIYRRSYDGSVIPHETKKDESLMSFEELPGPKCYPVIGTLYKYLPFLGEYDAEALDKNAWINWRKYGSLVKEMPGVPLLHVYDPVDIEAVFRQDDRYPARRSHIAMLHYRVSKPRVYNTGGLLSTNGPDWWRLRTTFQKNFTSPQSVKDYVRNTDVVTQEFIQWIKGINISQQDFLPYLNKLNLEVIGMVAFSERFHSFSPEEQTPESRSNKIIKAAFLSNCGIIKLDKGFLWKIFQTPLYRRLAQSQEYLEKISTDIFLKRVNFFESNFPQMEKSLLDSFIVQPNLDMKDIIGMMVDILMASIDTTGYTTSFALYHIARNKCVQDKIFEEISSILPNNSSDISPDVLSKAIYVRSVIKESLRLNPVSIGVGRLLQKDIVLRRYLIPKGTVIVTQNMVASRLPQFVKNPLEFKPERWIRGSPHYENLHPFLSLPFGFGPRSCIARRLAEQNICITLIRLIREFEVKWVGEELGIRTLLINKPDKPVTLSFTQRK